MPPRPRRPATRYRPATTVPGKKRPSSTEVEVPIRAASEAEPWEPTSASWLDAGPGKTAVSTEVEFSGDAHQEQYRPSGLCREHDGQLTMVFSYLSARARPLRRR